MGTRWDRSSPVYLEEWLPRFAPYHVDLAREIGVREGDRVLVANAGPDVVPFARAVGPSGRVRATVRDVTQRAACEARLIEAGLASRSTLSVAQPEDTADAPFDVVVCPFGLRGVDRSAALAAWRSALARKGKVGLILWGPPSEDDPEGWLAQAARELDPSLDFGPEDMETSREALGAALEDAGLALVRHTVVRHNVTFRSADAFVRAIRDASEWRSAHAALDATTAARLIARVCELAGGPDQPVVFNPAATIAIAGLPGEEVELPHRPSVRIPAVKASS